MFKISTTLFKFDYLIVLYPTQNYFIYNPIIFSILIEMDEAISYSYTINF